MRSSKGSPPCASCADFVEMDGGCSYENCIWLESASSDEPEPEWDGNISADELAALVQQFGANMRAIRWQMGLAENGEFANHDPVDRPVK